MSAGATPLRDKGHALRVLTLTPFYPSADDDGSGCFVAEPLQWLEKIVVQNTVLAVQPFYRKRRIPLNNGIPVRSLGYCSAPGGIGLSTAGAFLFARIVTHVREFHRQQQIDLIHAHGPLPCGHAAMLLSAELNIPYVVSVHGLDAYSTEQVHGRAGQWCRRISQRVYRSSRRVICISERVREQVLEGVGQSSRTSVVYNGVDTELFSPKKELSSTIPVILGVGNLIPIKGHELLVRSLAELRAEFEGVTLEIVGDGPELGRLQALAAKLGVSMQVRFLGRQSRQQVAEAMQQCTVFALPSRFEGLGCVYLEAMSTSKPVVGCRGQGIAEVIQHGSNGFLVGPDNGKELTLVLAMLLRDERRRRSLGAAARETILDRFTLAQQAENLSRIYRESVA